MESGGLGWEPRVESGGLGWEPRVESGEQSSLACT